MALGIIFLLERFLYSFCLKNLFKETFHILPRNDFDDK